MGRWIMMLGLLGCTGTPAPPPPGQATPTPAAAESAKGQAPLLGQTDGTVRTVLEFPGVVACNRCALEARGALRSAPGIVQMRADIKTGRYEIYHRPELTADQLLKAAADQGYQGVVVEGTAVPVAPTVETVTPVPDTDTP